MFPSICVFFIALSLRTVKSDEPVYRAVGDEVVLKPDPVQGPITGITWKHGKDIAIEWYQGPVEGYRQFKKRGSLNVTTGALTITGLTPGESGSYTAEINNKVTGTTQLLVISRVSKPTVSSQCDADHCVFTCESNDTTAEPVTYSWMAGDKLLNSSKEIRITKDESEKQFHCELRNPVSTEMSELVHNPFKTGRTRKLYSRVLIICLVLLIGGIFSLMIFIFYKRNKKVAHFGLDDLLMLQRQQLNGDRPHRALLAVRAPSAIDVSLITQLSEPPEGSNNVPATNGPSETRHNNVVSEVEGSMNHVPTPTAPLDNSEEREPLMGSSGDPESYVSSETGRKDETILEIPPVQVHTNQTASEDTVNETEVPGGSNQDLTSDAAPGSSSEPDVGASPDQVLTDATNEAVRRVITQSSVGSFTYTGRVADNPATGSEPPEGSNHGPATNGPSETGRKDASETILEIPPVQVPTNQTASEDAVNEKEVPGGSNQDPTSDAAPESSSETVVSAVEVSMNHVLTPTAPLENSKEREVPGGSNQDLTSVSDCLKDQGISTHNQETSALTESTNRTEESTFIPSVQDSPVQEQAADGQNQT